MNIYIQTSDPAKNVKITRNAVTLTAALPITSFNLTNTAKTATMRNARAVAANAGLTLRDAKRIAVTH